jgi:hypothetical protein
MDIVEGSAPSKTKEKTAHRVGAGDVGALTTLRTFARTDRKKMMVINLDRLAPYVGTARDERLGRSHRENRTTGRKMRPSTDVVKTALGKEEMAVPL